MKTPTPSARSLRKRVLLFFIFQLPLLIGAMLMLFFGLRDLIRGRASLTWPTAQGVIRQSVVREQHRQDANGNHRTSYHEEITYDFQVNDQRYTGNRIAFWPSLAASNNAAYADMIISRYPLGRAVPIHHHPAEPALCVLEPGVKWSNWLLPGCGLFLVILAISIGRGKPRSSRQYDP